MSNSILGQMNISNNPFLIRARLPARGRYITFIACVVDYENPPDGNNYEVIFTPCFTGTYLSGGNNRDNFLMGTEIVNGSYVQPVNITRIPLVNGSFSSVRSITPAQFIYSQGKLRVEGKYLVNRVNQAGFRSVYADRVNPLEGSIYDFSSSDPFFTPTTIAFAGHPYYLSFIFFRWLSPIDATDNNGLLLTPSFCDDTFAGNKPHLYMCNSDRNNPQNELRYLSINKADDNTNAMTIDQQTIIPNSTLFYFVPTQYYPGNARFTGNSIIQGGGVCTLTSNAVNMLEQYFYFAASDFSQFKNVEGSLIYPMISNTMPAFIGKGTNNPVAIVGWTSLSDCQRGYFYSYCENISCGTCYGACSAGDSCFENPNYINPPPSGQEPFACSLEPIPPEPQPTPNQWQDLWNKYKYWIIGGIIVLVLLIGGAILLVALLVKNRNSENTSGTLVNYE